MKFGHNLHRYQVVEWAPFYIDYQALNAQSHGADRREDADLSGLLKTVICL